MEDLLERALARGFVFAPAQEARAVAETRAGEMVVLHFQDERGLERLPFVAAPGTPAAGAAGRPSCKPGWLNKSFQSRPEGAPFVFPQGNGLQSPITTCSSCAIFQRTFRALPPNHWEPRRSWSSATVL